MKDQSRIDHLNRIDHLKMILMIVVLPWLFLGLVLTLGPPRAECAPARIINSGQNSEQAKMKSAKITICHYLKPKKNKPENKTLIISEKQWLKHQKHGDTLGPCGSDNNEYSTTIEPATGGVLTATDGDLKGVSILIPPGALLETTTITLRKSGEPTNVFSTQSGHSDAELYRAQLAPLFVSHFKDFVATHPQSGTTMISSVDSLEANVFFMAHMDNPVPVVTNRTIEFLPSGTQFLIPAQVTIPFSLLGFDTFPTDVVVAFAIYDESHGWQIISNHSVDATAKTITLEISHFSILASILYKVADLARTFGPYLDFYPCESEQLLNVTFILDLEATIKNLKSQSCVEINHSSLGQHSARELLVYLGAETGAADLALRAITLVTKPWEELEAQFYTPTLPMIGNLKDYIINFAATQGSKKMTVERILLKSLELARGDMFWALIIAHNTLTKRLDNYNDLRSALPALDAFEFNPEDPDRGDWYHIFGAAALSYLSGSSIPPIVLSAHPDLLACPNLSKYRADWYGSLWGVRLRDLKDSQNVYVNMFDSSYQPNVIGIRSDGSVHEVIRYSDLVEAAGYKDGLLTGAQDLALDSTGVYMTATGYELKSDLLKKTNDQDHFSKLINEHQIGSLNTPTAGYRVINGIVVQGQRIYMDTRNAHFNWSSADKVTGQDIQNVITFFDLYPGSQQASPEMIISRPAASFDVYKGKVLLYSMEPSVEAPLASKLFLFDSLVPLVSVVGTWYSTAEDGWADFTSMSMKSVDEYIVIHQGQLKSVRDGVASVLPFPPLTYPTYPTAVTHDFNGRQFVLTTTSDLYRDGELFVSGIDLATRADLQSVFEGGGPLSGSLAVCKERVDPDFVPESSIKTP